MKTTVDIPEDLYRRAQVFAAQTGSTLRTLILNGLSREVERTLPAQANRPFYWATRKLIPELDAALRKGAFKGGTDSTVAVSEERSQR